MTIHPDRQFRIDEIRDSATVRDRLGQAAQHKRLPDGSHQVTLAGRVFVGATLDEVFDRARSGKDATR